MSRKLTYQDKKDALETAVSITKEVYRGGYSGSHPKDAIRDIYNELLKITKELEHKD